MSIAVKPKNRILPRIDIPDGGFQPPDDPTRPTPDGRKPTPERMAFLLSLVDRAEAKRRNGPEPSPSPSPTQDVAQFANDPSAKIPTPPGRPMSDARRAYLNSLLSNSEGAADVAVFASPGSGRPSAR